uniref:Glutaredoxin family protein n=1 Tax=Geobacter metallireducens TaxID=28232 RepID=A0A831U288_GEOME
MLQRIIATVPAAILVTGLVGGCVPSRPPVSPASPNAAAAGKPLVTVYVRTGCSFCREAREFFAARGVPVRERNVVTDRSALVEMLDIHLRRFPDEEPIVPLIVIGDRALSGFERQEVEAALTAAEHMAAGSK